jgi:AraC-like DNA-binding protein
MLDDIYLRLLYEIAPSELSPSHLEIQRALESHNEGLHSNASYGKLVKSIYLADAQSNIGLKLGQFLLPSQLCDFSRVLVTSENLLAALKLLERLYYVQGTCYHPFISCANGKVSFALIFPYKHNPSEQHRRFCAETAFAYLVNGLRESIAPNFRPSKVIFDYPKPEYDEQYAPLLGNNVSFGHALNMIEFDDHYLYKKNGTHSPTLHQMYLNKCLDKIRTNDRQSSFEHKAISCLLRHHPDTLNSKKLAEKLNISVRGLQKRLSKTGQSFSSIANDCRRELAKVYLIQEHQSLDYTAEQLGFQTCSGFRRFFKSEFSKTPAEFLEHTIEHND